MIIFRQSRKPEFRVIPNLFFFLFIIPLLLFLNCLKTSEHSKSNRIFENYLRYYTENNLEYRVLHRFDDHLVQIKPAYFKAYIRTLDFYENKIAALDTVKLSPQNQIDFILLKRHLGQLRFEFEKRQNWQHDPEWYCELAGNSFYWPTAVKSLTRERVEGIFLARLKQLPRFFSQAQTNLMSSSPGKIALAQQKTVALELFLTQKMAQMATENPAFADSLKLHQPAALEALKVWQDFLQSDLSAADDERLFGAVLTEWLTLNLGDDFNLRELQSICRNELIRLPAQMQATTCEVYCKYFPLRDYQRAAASVDGFRLQEAVEKIENDFLKPEAFLPFIREIAVESERFLQFKNLIKVLNSGAINFTLLPEFLSGKPFANTIVQGKQYFFLLRLKEGYWHWSQELDFTKYFHKNRLKLVALGQIIPGQILQKQYADSLATPIQQYFGDLPMQAGWTLFAPWLMRKSGFTGYDPAFILTQQMDYFQAALGTFLCLQFHLNELDEAGVRQALKNQGLLEGVVLDAFLAEMILHPEQVIARFFGFFQLRQLYEDARLHLQNHFDLIDFNQKILNSGFVPIQSVRRCLLRQNSSRFDIRASKRSINGENKN